MTMSWIAFYFNQYVCIYSSEILSIAKHDLGDLCLWKLIVIFNFLTMQI